MLAGCPGERLWSEDTTGLLLALGSKAGSFDFSLSTCLELYSKPNMSVLQTGEIR
jgi:hypothetical protein